MLAIDNIVDHMGWHDDTPGLPRLASRVRWLQLFAL
jgi:hypothetical protein